MDLRHLRLPTSRTSATPLRITRIVAPLLVAATIVSGVLSPATAAESHVLSGKMTLPEDGGSMRRTNFPKVKVSAAKPERWFRIKVPAPTVVNVTVTGPFFKPRNGLRGKSSALHDLTAQIRCELLDANEQPIATSDRNELAAEFLRRVALQAGTYYLRVSYVAAGPEEDRTDILVLVSAGADWDVVTSANGDDGPGEAHHVGFLPVPGKSPLAADIPTWIVTHGRNDAPGGREDGPGTFFSLAKALARIAPNAQQALLDWTTAAAPKSGFDLSGGRWFPKIGVALGARLSDPTEGRFSGDELSLVGHSWGTYVNHEIARAIREDLAGGEVNRLIALDPALTAGNYEVTSADFSANSQYAFALYTSGFGNGDVAQTADDAFDVNVQGTTSVFEKHNAAHEFFRDLLVQSDRISIVLRQAVVNRGNNLWERDPALYDTVMTGRDVSATIPTPADEDFEGVISISKPGAHWRPTTFRFNSAQ